MSPGQWIGEAVGMAAGIGMWAYVLTSLKTGKAHIRFSGLVERSKAPIPYWIHVLSFAVGGSIFIGIILIFDLGWAFGWWKPVAATW